jgi:hypothetical protein
MSHHDRPPFSGGPSLTGIADMAGTCSTRQPQEGTVKKGLHRPRLNAIIPILTAAGLILIAAPFSSRLSRYTGHAFLGSREQMHRVDPFAEWYVAALEHGPDRH